ncbi:S41 family peptidase [Alteromonas naphthalenivorans]|nr:S41 family peptidase [Alteromonas naphthalenivorans]
MSRENSFWQRDISVYLNCRKHDIIMFATLFFLTTTTSFAQQNDVECVQLNNKMKLELIEELKTKINLNYVEIDKIPLIIKTLEAIKHNRAFANVKSRQDFTRFINNTLLRIDQHFSVSSNLKSSGAPLKESWSEKLARLDWGFERVEVSVNNIGLLRFWGFADLNETSKEVISNHMRAIENVDGLIIDLRDNGGGSAQTVQYISSYFLKGRQHLNTFYSRASDSFEEFYTDPAIDFPHLSQIPIVIIIGPKTFSAAEEFAYNFKHMSRAMVIGKTSKGGANPWRYFELQHGLRFAIPTAKAINPVTQSNWEGVGVQPHLYIELEDAEQKATELLVRKLHVKRSIINHNN